MELLRAHGAHVSRPDDLIDVNHGHLTAHASYEITRHEAGRCVIVAHFAIKPSSRKAVVESFAGIGKDLLSALKDVCKNFADASFHVMFAVLIDPACDHVERETWTISGKKRRITLGPLLLRNEFPMEIWPEVYAGLRRDLEATDIPSGLHWMRYFYATAKHERMEMEVLLDGQNSVELQARAIRHSWPLTDYFTSARLFLMIEDA